ncbi:MAG: methyltransferase domain-containing protein [Lachnospiraceae bacterium]|nr:methyltransferase domain-containing protein [Lachnospiraceae bacterium]
MMDVFQDYARFYNALYKEKDYSKEAKEADSIIKKWDPAAKTMIVYGCGTGKHDVCFEKLGYRLHGIDMSREMVEEAQKASSSITYEVADIRTYEPKEKYDVVVSMFHVMSYQNSNEDICNAFVAARKALDKDGIFLFDAWYGPGVLSDPPALRVKDVEEKDFRIRRIARPVVHANTDIVDVNYELLVEDKDTHTLKTITESHHMRYFFKPEIEMYLKEAGFELLEVIDCNTLKEPDFGSWTAYFAARAL